MLIKYDDIKGEFKKLGLTSKDVADILETSPQNLSYLIKQGGARIHLLTYALSNYYGKTE